MCVGARSCVWALCTTFPQSLKHDGTASKQRWPDAGLSVLQSQDISMQRDRGCWFQLIWKTKQKKTKKKLKEEFGQQFNERSQKQPDHFECALSIYCRLSTLTETEDNALCNLKGIQQPLGKRLFDYNVFSVTSRSVLPPDVQHDTPETMQNNLVPST